MVKISDLQVASPYTTLGEVVVKPGEKVNFFVGMYEDALPQPRINLDFANSKQNGNISASLTRVNNGGDYTLVYQLENNGDAACRIAVSAVWPE